MAQPAVVYEECVAHESSWDADEALTAVYTAHYTSLVRLGALLLRDTGTAEEIVQDAFVAMHGRWHRLRDPHKALAYLRTAVVNRCRSRQRHLVVVDKHTPAIAAGRAERRTRGTADGRDRPGDRSDAHPAGETTHRDGAAVLR